MKIKKTVAQGFIELSDLAKIVYDLAEDVVALNAAFAAHVHPENSAGTYTQDADTEVTTTTVDLKTTVL